VRLHLGCPQLPVPIGNRPRDRDLVDAKHDRLINWPLLCLAYCLYRMTPIDFSSVRTRATLPAPPPGVVQVALHAWVGMAVVVRRVDKLGGMGEEEDTCWWWWRVDQSLFCHMEMEAWRSGRGPLAWQCCMPLFCTLQRSISNHRTG
jgi:hypothetical protein